MTSIPSRKRKKLSVSTYLLHHLNINMNRFRKKMQEQLEEEERIKWQDAIDGDLNTSFCIIFLQWLKYIPLNPKLNHLAMEV